MVDTKWTGPGRWPYPKVGLVYPGLAVCHDKLYVFGGMHDCVTVGCNLWIVLDLTTFEWRKLGGHTGPTLVPEHSMPGPRKHPMIWVEGDQGQERIWLQYGMEDRAGAQLLNTDYAADLSYAYDDMWKVAWTYNPVLKKTIIFGGYNPMLPTRYTELNAVFEFSYYADTFIFDSTSNESIQPKWKHVLTRGFPIYRAQAKLFSDPETGKMFLFGGCTNSQFVPDRKYAIQRSFGDLWQLKLDMPRGHFEGVDLEEEALTAKAGPWQRCFTCGSAGPWRKCGSTCCGKAFFCNVECLKEGWKEHRERHGCSKR
ncbi:MYND-type zinc finger protein samB [Abortiporus biennis]